MSTVSDNPTARPAALIADQRFAINLTTIAWSATHDERSHTWTRTAEWWDGWSCSQANTEFCHFFLQPFDIRAKMIFNLSQKVLKYKIAKFGRRRTS